MYNRKIEGEFVYKGGRIAIVAARFNSFIVDSLLNGALDSLKRHGVPEDKIDVVYVPGAYELPVVIKNLASRSIYQGFLALGTVIRGGTAHFEYVAGECAKGLTAVSLEYAIPVSFGVLTTETIEQAIERSGTKAGNKGAEAAASLLETINVISQIKDLS